jgi:DNA polymerase-3 subunit delta'
MPFRDLVGHRHLLDLLRRAAARDTLPPSLIFAGPEGVGKRAAAVSLAQFVNCLVRTGGDESADACGACAACRRIARGVHADVLEVVPGESGSIKIEQVRDAIDRSAYRPFEGRRRVVIIDEADALGVEAQNALLKTLEEPPPASIFVLVTARPDALLPTVRSRCQRIRFGRLSEDDIAGVLRAMHGYNSTEAHAAAAAADGSLAVALAGGTGEFAEARDAASALLAALDGTPGPAAKLTLAKAFAGGPGTDRERLVRQLHVLASLVRDVGLLLAGGDERWLANGDLRAALEARLGAWDADRVLRAASAIDRALGALDRYASPKIVADWITAEI